MKVSFAPLDHDAVRLLGARTGIDFSYASFQPPNWFCATARNSKNAIMGIVACEWKNRFDVLFNCTVIDRRCMSRRVLRAIFTALFSKAVRVTAEVAVDNGPALNAILRMGFVLEGYCRRGVNGVKDAYVFGMLREDCVFLPGYRSKMRPALPPFYLPYGNLVNPESGSDLGLRTPSPTNGQHLIRRKLGHLVALAVLVVGMVAAFSSVGLPRFPAQMVFVDTARCGAGVCGIMLGRRWPVLQLATDPVQFTGSAVPSGLRIAALVDRKRPQNAFVGFDLNQDEKQFSGGNHTVSLEV